MSKNRAVRPVTWIELAVANAGIRKALTGLTWAYCWSVVREALGEDPSVEQVAQWWGEPPRTAYREQAAFRTAFPTLETPAKLHDNPDFRRKLGEAVKLAADLERHGLPRTVSDNGVLELGLMAATI